MAQTRCGSCLTLPVLSGSMMPYLPPGGQIRVECAPAVSSHLGDIIVFREAGRLIAHRLLIRLRVGRRCYLYQKGDAARIGCWVSEDRLVGVVTQATAPDGTCLYLRPGRRRGPRERIYRHLLRDLLERGRFILRALVRGAGSRRERGR